MQYQIKWRKQDYLQLGKAVANFNKKINKLQAEENKTYLPELVNYQDLKQNITTRAELNRQINSLRRFMREDAENIYTTEAGEQITKWQKNEISIDLRVAKSRLQKELKTLNEPLEGGYSRAQMGSERVREINAELKNLSSKSFETKVGKELKYFIDSLKKRGSSDYLMKKSIIYRENYLNEMKKYADFNNYDKLMEKLESIKNPISFYNFVSANELTKDLTYQSDEYFTQQAFNSFLEDLGIEIDEDSITVEDNSTEDNSTNYRYSLIVNGKIVSQSDSRELLNRQALDMKGNIIVIEN